MNKFIVTISISALLSGCMTVGPDYKAPESKDYQVDDLTEEKGKEILAEHLGLWWQQFNDDNLNQLIKASFTDSYTMQSAQAKIRQSRALLGISDATKYPTIDFNGSKTRGRHESYSLGGNGTTDFYSTGFDVAWELDIFGGNRRRVEAATAELQASELSLENIWVSLASEVAASYISLRGYQQQLKVAESNLNIQTVTLEILEDRYKSGLTDKLDVEQARYNMERTRSSLPPIRISIEKTLNQLALLVGKTPGELHESLSKFAKIPVPPLNSVGSIPMDAIRQRPDIKQAERVLAAETAKIGVSKSDIYPKFYLNGSIGLKSINSSNFISSENRYNSFGPAFSWNIFDAGAINNRTDAQVAKVDEVRANYNKTILSAIKELRDALISLSEGEKRYNSLNKAVKAAELAEVLAKDQYKNGLTTFNSILDAQRSLYELQSRLAESESVLSENVVRVYKSLGGGWQNLNN